MQLKKINITTAVLTLALTSGALLAQPALNKAGAAEAGKEKKAKAAKGDKAAKAGKGAKGDRGQQATPVLTPKVLEKVLGKPLTDEQTKAVEDAQKTYADSVAKAVGLTPEEFKTKMADYRKAQRAEKGITGGDKAKKADKVN